MMNRIWDKENKYTKGLLKEYRYWVTEVSYNQHTLGCYIIFSKRDVQKISELSSVEIDELRDVMKEIETALLQNNSFKPDRFNYCQLGNLLHHLHFHGIPRHKDARMFDGKKWTDNSYGSPPIWAKKNISDSLVEKINTEIKLFLDK